MITNDINSDSDFVVELRDVVVKSCNGEDIFGRSLCVFREAFGYI